MLPFVHAALMIACTMYACRHSEAMARTCHATHVCTRTLARQIARVKSSSSSAQQMPCAIPAAASRVTRVTRVTHHTSIITPIGIPSSTPAYAHDNSNDPHQTAHILSVLPTQNRQPQYSSFTCPRLLQTAHRLHVARVTWQNFLAARYTVVDEMKWKYKASS